MSSIVMFSTHAQINDRIFTSTALVDSDSSRNQMHSSQLSRLSEKAEESQQALNNLGFMNLEFKPSLCVGSQADAVMAGPAKGSSNNFQGQSGLMRYHSAPSSFLSTLAEEENNRIISQYFSNESSAALDSDRKPVQQNHPAQQNQPSVLNYHQPGDDAARLSSEQTKFVRRNAHHVSSLKRCLGSIPRDDMVKHHHLNAIFENVPDMSQDSYPTASIPILSQAQVSPSSGQQMESYQLNPICSNNLNHGPNNVNGGYPATSKMSLIRHSSSPAGLLSESVTEAQASFENGYAEGPVRNSMDMESTCGNIRMPNKLPRPMNCMRQNSSPSRFLTQMCRDIHASENQAGSGNDDGVLNSGNARSGYISSYSLDQWDDRTVPVNFAGLQNGTMFPSGKRTKEFDEGMKQELSEARTGETGNRSFSALAGHSMNLSRSASAELAMEELLQDAVPCKVRAKRGCATHPRSIAERVRRTRISERMRKLQELVPNSDKQTVNIADMLDEAVEYVKSLQRQVQELTEKRDKCTCAHKPECTYKS